MRTILSWFILLLLVATGGCAGSGTMTTKTTTPDGTVTETSQPGSFMGPSSYDLGYTQMYSSFMVSRAERAKAIMSSPSPDNSEAKAYAEAAKLMGVAMLSMEKFDVKAPTTGFDVLNNAVNQIVPVSGFMALWKLGETGIKNAGNITLGNDSNVSGSFNRTETNTVSSGSGAVTTTHSPSDSQPITTTTNSYNTTN